MRKFTRYPSNYVQATLAIEALSRTTTDRPWRIIAYADPEFTEEVDNLTSSNRRDLQDFIIDCVTDGLYVLINYGRNWCECITPESYASSEKKWGSRYALGYATHVYDGDTSMFIEPSWD